MKECLRHIFSLGVKEIIGLFRDPLLMLLIVYCFTLSIKTGADSSPDAIDHAAIAIVDEDNSELSKRITDAFLPPLFLKPDMITRPEIERALDLGDYTFIVVFPANFQEKVMACHNPEVQVNVDATRMSQAFTGNGYIQQIITKEVNDYIGEKTNTGSYYTADALIRHQYNINLISAWQGALSQLVNSIALIALILTGAALIRERERGTLEHLLITPVTPVEIMISKIWSVTLVVLIATYFSIVVVIEKMMEIPINGSVWLFMFGVMLNLFAMTSLGIFLSCYTRDMPQFGMLMILVLMPMNILSGGSTPQSNMPPAIQYIMKFAPTTYFVEMCDGILIRGADFSLIYKVFIEVTLIGTLYFVLALLRFRKTVAN